MSCLFEVYLSNKFFKISFYIMKDVNIIFSVFSIFHLHVLGLRNCANNDCNNFVHCSDQGSVFME